MHINVRIKKTRLYVLEINRKVKHLARKKPSIEQTQYIENISRVDWMVTVGINGLRHVGSLPPPL